MLRVLALLCGLVACKGEPAPAESAPPDSPADSPSPSGPLDWASWTCQAAGDACEATYEDLYWLTCVPNAGTCRYGTTSGDYEANCTTWEGTGCAGCESAFAGCVAAWVATQD